MLKKGPLVAIIMLIAGVLACSFTEEEEQPPPPPATVPMASPQPSITPQSTIGPQVTLEPRPTQPPLVLPTAFTPEVPPNPPLTNQLRLVDNNRMINTISTLIGFENRHIFSEPHPEKGVVAARDYLYFALLDLQAQYPDNRIDVSIHQFNFPFGGELIYADNVMMVMNGTDATAGIVLISAHYDTISLPNVNDASNYQPGADDDASGVASLMEIARIMAQDTHRATVIFVLFTGEEMGRYGSDAYLKQYILPNNIQLKAVLNLDIVGSPTGPNNVRYDNDMRVFSTPPNDSNSRQLARLAEFAARYFVPDMRINIQEEVDRQGRWGDHMTFSEQGFAAIRLIEQADEPQRTHNALDNLDEIDADYLGRTTRVALATLLILADGPNPPTEITIDTDNWQLEWQPSRNAARYVIALRKPGSVTFDEEFTLDITNLTYPQLQDYETIAIAAINTEGQIGPFTPECPIRPNGGIYICD